MKTLPEQLRLEVAKQPWERKTILLIQAADELEKLKTQITDNAIMHVREMNKLLNP